jgi:hypothetical protein
VFDLKVALYSLTDVPPERQKILGLVKGKIPPDEVTMCGFIPLSFAEIESLNLKCTVTI